MKHARIIIVLSINILRRNGSPLFLIINTAKTTLQELLFFSKGETVKGIYQIYSGKIKIVSTQADGKERIVRLAKKEQILGHRGFGSDLVYPVSAITLTPAEITFIPLDIFHKAVKANPELAIAMLNFFADDLREMENRMEALSMMNAKEKLALALLIVINSFGFDPKDKQMLRYTPSRKDLSSIAGITNHGYSSQDQTNSNKLDIKIMLSH